MMLINNIWRECPKNNRGYTMIEIIAVLVILAIISVVVLVRGTITDTAKLQAEINTLKGHLRYAQYLAMNDIYPNKWGVQVQSTNYILVKDPLGTGVFVSPFNLPNESSATHNFGAPVTAVPATVLFDEWGSPGTTSITLTISGQTITITAETGFIP